MATAGPNFCGTGANFNDGGTLAWTTPTNIQGDTTTTAATVNLAANGNTSQRLRASNFALSIPAGSTITGVTVEVEQQAGNANRHRWNSVRLLVGGSESGDDKSDASAIPTAKGFKTFGGSADTWGLSITQAQATASGFGVSLKVDRNAAQATTTSLFRARITVEYTPIQGAASLAGSGVASAAGSLVAMGAAQTAGSGTLAASGTRIRSGAAALSGAGALGATGTLTRPGASALSGAGILGANGTRLRTSASSLSGVGTLSAAGESLTPGGSWGAPQNLIATAVSTSQIDLSWDEVTDASGYDVERNGVVVATDVVDTAYQDTALASSTLYTYRVRAVA